MASTHASGETPPRKKRKRSAPDDTFVKNVLVLRNGRDVTKRRDNVVLMPNTTLDVSRIKKDENGRQFKKITFNVSMTVKDVETLFLETFPFLCGQRFSCASAVDGRTRLDFHGEPCIWSAALIKKKITGNSALYIFSEENTDHLMNTELLMENLSISNHVSTTVVDASDTSDSGFETAGASCSFMRGDLLPNRSITCLTPNVLQVLFPFDDELNDTYNEYSSADDWVMYGVHHDVEQEEMCQSAAAAENFHDDVEQEETCQSAAAAENLVQEIVPSSDSVKGGKKFHITLTKELPDNIKSGKVRFGDIHLLTEVPVTKLNSFTFTGFIPAAQQPGLVDVIVVGEANEHLGKTHFLYEDEVEKVISQLAEDPAGMSKLFKLLSQQYDVKRMHLNVLRNTGAQQPGQADVLLEMEKVILQFEEDPAEMSKLFRLLSQQYDVKRIDSNAAGTGDEQILKNGQLSCSEESDDSQSDYFADAENSSCISLELDSDWSDTEDMVEPTNSFGIPPELDSNWSDSEDRVEPINSSCISLELDSDWSDSEDMVEPIDSSCSSLELDSDWSDSEDRAEGVHRSLWILYSTFNELNLSAMVKRMLDKENRATREWPTCSLPPLENKKKESTVKGAIKDDIDHDSSCTVDVSTESGFFSGGGTLHDSNKISSNVLSLALANSSPHSLVLETENEKSQCGTAAVPETEGSEEAFTASTPRTDSSQQSDEITPLFSTTPEAPRSSHNTPVTGRSSPKAVALHPLGNDEQHVNNSSQSRASICPLMVLRKEPTRKANLCPVNIGLKLNPSAEKKVGKGTRGDSATQQEKGTRNCGIVVCGLAEDSYSIPPDTLKADSCLEDLGKVLRIKTTRYVTVCEPIRNYEERFGQLSLKLSRYNPRQRGYLEYFQQHVAADQIMADVTDIDDLDDLKDKLSQAATKQWPRNDFGSSYRHSSSNSPLRRSLPGQNQLQGQRKSLKHQSREFGHETDKEFNVDAMTKGAVQMISDQTNPKATREWPVWSLLPSENKKHERAVNVAIKDVSDRDSTSTVNVSADLFSGEDTLHDSNKISSNVLSLALANSSPRSLVPETENEKSQCGTAAVPETEGSEEAFTSTASRTYSSHNSNINLRKPHEVNKQNAMQGNTKGDKDHDSTVDTTTKSGFFSAEETSYVEAIQRHLEAIQRRFKVKIETCQRENAATPLIERRENSLYVLSRIFTDSSQQSEKITTRSGPTTAEGHYDSMLRPSFNNPRSVALHSLGSDEQCVNNNGEESGNPTEHYNLSFTKLQKTFQEEIPCIFRTHFYHSQIEASGTLLEDRTRVPLEVIASLKVYNEALAEGKTFDKRVQIVVIRQVHSGKISLKNSLRGELFTQDQESTVGIDVDPSHFKVTTENWKVGEKDQETNSETSISCEYHAAGATVENLRQEEIPPDPEEKIPDAMPSGNNPKQDTVTPSSSNDDTSVPSAGEFDMPSASSLTNDITSASSSSTSSDESVKEAEVDPEPVQTFRHSEQEVSILKDVETEVLKRLKNSTQEEDEEVVHSVLWDFAGQSVYYTMHPLFLTPRAVYLLVNDLSHDLFGPAKPIPKQELYTELEDSYGFKTNIHCLDFWMSSVATLASQQESDQVSSESEVLPMKPAALFSVFTHVDTPYDSQKDPSTLASGFYGSFHTTLYMSFLRDNHGSECPVVVCLHEEVTAVSKELSQMKEAIPIKWLKYEKELQAMRESGEKWITLEKAKTVASEKCNIVDEKEFQTSLTLVIDKRVLIHFDGTSDLGKWYDHKEKKFNELWQKCEDYNILYANMKYEVCSICPVCCEGGSVIYCRIHKEGCEKEECLHLWTESELYNKKSNACEKNPVARTTRIKVEEIAPRLAPPSCQLTADEHDERALTSAASKEVKLPDEVLESLLSQSCDAKEVVLQLGKTVPLDQDSLQELEPESKALIRCLARQVKELNRLDVFEHLREITPAGTTGSRLPENGLLCNLMPRSESLQLI